VVRVRLLLLVTLTAGLWGLDRLATTYGLFPSAGFARVLKIAAVTSAAILAVAAIGWVISEIGISLMLRTKPTGVHRAVVYGILSVGGLAGIFTYFGVDLTALITTSAVFTAAAGLALQPTLGGVIAGMIVHGDRIVQRGDAVLIENEPVEVVSLGWRSVVARTASGDRMTIPNARIADQTLRIFSQTEASRIETLFPAPLTIPPRLIDGLVTELISDMAVVETMLPIVVTPVAFDTVGGFARYRARYWVRDVVNRTDIDGEVLRRIWHGFQREHIPWPVAGFFDAKLREWATDSSAPGSSLHISFQDRLVTSAESGDRTGAPERANDVLLFAPGERMVIPEHHRDSRFLLAEGELRISTPSEVLSSNLGHAVRWQEQEVSRMPLSRRAALRIISDRLAEEIGPYAELAVSEAASKTDSIDDVIELASTEIDGALARKTFREALTHTDATILRRGYRFAARRDSAGLLMSDPPTRAMTYVAILTFARPRSQDQ
jgi:small-conductance mechanosensitive channel